MVRLRCSPAQYSPCGLKPVKTRDKAAAPTFINKALKHHGSPEAITTDGLRSYKAAMKGVGNTEKQEIGRWATIAVRTHTSPFDDESGRYCGFGR
jgi:transposase-like protein